jgi:hypothetical protein
MKQRSAGTAHAVARPTRSGRTLVWCNTAITAGRRSTRRLPTHHGVRLHISRSNDRGETWSAVEDSTLPNPGSGAEVRVLANIHWVLVYNDLEQGRYSLAVSLSEDAGATWRWTRHLERSVVAGQGAPEPPQRGQYHDPSILQARDGTLHATYSYFIPPAESSKDEQGRLVRKAIKHAHFNEAWIRAGTRFLVKRPVVLEAKLRGVSR